MIRNTMTAALVAALAFGCSGEPKEKPADPHDHSAKHGGVVLEVGAHEAHLEIVHDEKTGKMTAYLRDGGNKEGVPLAKAPEIKLKTKDGPKQIAMTAVGAQDGKASQWEVTDDALKAHELDGHITLEMGGKTYNPKIDHGHDH